MSKKSSEILKTKETSELKKFITSVIDLGKNPQIFKQWIKEKKAWKHNLNIPEKVGVSDKIEIKKIKKEK
jgi:hypothetical protein